MSDDKCCKFPSLLLVMQACISHVVFSQTTGKNAFCAYFGALPFKRLRPESWKSEYILRAHLLRYILLTEEQCA